MGLGPVSTATGDFNNDGRTDLATVNTTSFNLIVSLSQGDGTFNQEIYTAPFMAAPIAVVAGDFNGDGRTDLAVYYYRGGIFGSPGSRLGEIEIFLGLGDGTFKPALAIPVLANSRSTQLVAGDFDGNGLTDLALNQEVILFEPGLTYKDVINPLGGLSPDPNFVPIAAGDFNGDGKTDLIAQNGGGEVMLAGLGNGQFGPQAGSSPLMLAGSLFINSPQALIVDENISGSGNVLTINHDAAGHPITAVAGTFPTAHGSVTIASNGTYTYTPDNGFVGDESFTFTAQAANGTKSQTGTMNVTVLGQPTVPPQILTVDEDGSLGANVLTGILDAAGDTFTAVAGTFSTAHGSVTINSDGSYIYTPKTGFIGNDSFTFTAQAGTFSVSGTVNVLVAFPVSGQTEIGDFNGDGIPDVAIMNSGQIYTFLGNGSNGVGNGTFTYKGTTVLPSGAGAFTVGNFNGDGRTDLAVTVATGNGSGGQGDGYVAIYLNNGAGTFSETPQSVFKSLAVAPGPNAIFAGDFSGNGRSDLAVTSNIANFTGQLTALFGAGDGSFFNPSLQPAPTPQAIPLVADLNGDGTPDLIVLDQKGNILYRQGNPQQPGVYGLQSWSIPTNRPATSPSSAKPWEAKPPTGWRRWTSTRTESRSIRTRTASSPANPLSTVGVFPTQIASADLNGDGLGDLVVVNSGSNNLSVFLGAPAGGFVADGRRSLPVSVPST